jgi:hypothetical protein
VINEFGNIGITTKSENMRGIGPAYIKCISFQR